MQRPDVWHFRLLGAFDANRNGVGLPRLRSRTSRALMAYLALSPGKELSRTALAEMFWPDSDGDRQHQSVRRSLTDLRQALEEDEARGQVLCRRAENVMLDRDRVTSDVDEFREAIRHAERERGNTDNPWLSRAIELYRGPLLPGFNELCFSSIRFELEERFAWAVQSLCRCLMSLDPRSAVGIGRAAVIKAPLREDVHLVLMESLLAAGMPSEALRQFEEWERTLDELLGETPSAAAYQLLEAIPKSAPRKHSPAAPSLLLVGVQEDEPMMQALQASLSEQGKSPELASSLDSTPLIRRALERAEAVVLVDSPASRASEWVASMVEIALENESARGARVIWLSHRDSPVGPVDREPVGRWSTPEDAVDLARVIRDHLSAPLEHRLELELSAGAVPLDSQFYVNRDADRELKFALERHEGVVLLQGPRQVGKTSLLARALDGGRRLGWKTALCDFQSLGASQVEDQSRLYRSIAHRFAKDLGVGDGWTSEWNEWLGLNDNLDEAVERILVASNERVTWGFDEVDRLFGQPYSDDLFGLIRGWHNRRALEPQGPWSRLTIVLTYATEAHLFIRDLNQSPFNVGFRIEPKDFRLDHLAELANRYRMALGEEDLHHLEEVVGGQPYLVRRAFDWLASNKGKSVADLDLVAVADSGPFGDHLKRLGAVVKNSPELSRALAEFIQLGLEPEPMALGRLAAGGVLVRSPILRFRCPIYRSYLGGVLRTSLNTIS